MQRSEYKVSRELRRSDAGTASGTICAADPLIWGSMAANILGGSPGFGGGITISPVSGSTLPLISKDMDGGLPGALGMAGIELVIDLNNFR